MSLKVGQQSINYQPRLNPRFDKTNEIQTVPSDREFTNSQHLLEIGNSHQIRGRSLGTIDHINEDALSITSIDENQPLLSSAISNNSNPLWNRICERFHVTVPESVRIFVENNRVLIIVLIALILIVVSLVIYFATGDENRWNYLLKFWKTILCLLGLIDCTRRHAD